MGATDPGHAQVGVGSACEEGRSFCLVLVGVLVLFAAHPSVYELGLRSGSGSSQSPDLDVWGWRNRQPLSPPFALCILHSALCTLCTRPRVLPAACLRARLRALPGLQQGPRLVPSHQNASLAASPASPECLDEGDKFRRCTRRHRHVNHATSDLDPCFAWTRRKRSSSVLLPRSACLCASSVNCLYLL
jgi:hypothetical protein